MIFNLYYSQPMSMHCGTHCLRIKKNINVLQSGCTNTVVAELVFVKKQR